MRFVQRTKKDFHNDMHIVSPGMPFALDYNIVTKNDQKTSGVTAQVNIATQRKALHCGGLQPEPR